MTIKAIVIADSVSPIGARLTTLQLRYPRMIHSELMTHRMFSRNASSSRAIPVKKMLAWVLEAPATPIHWGKNQPGMQARAENRELVTIPARLTELFRHMHTGAVGVDDGDTIQVPRDLAWRFSAELAAMMSSAFNDAGYHKQLVNRITEPYQYINVIVTATDWQNFFDLRISPEAMPEICELATKIRDAMAASVPVQRANDQDWHLPYIRDDELNNGLGVDNLIRMSAARCARVSYMTTEGKQPTPNEDLALYSRLADASPPHLSPLEHQALPLPFDCYCANFRGWQSWRNVVETKAKHAIDLTATV